MRTHPQLLATVAAIAVTATACPAAVAATGCAPQQTTMRAAAVVVTVDKAQVQNDRLIVSLRRLLIASDRHSARASSVSADVRKLIGAKRKLAAARAQESRDMRQYMMHRGFLRRCESTRR
jgi:hypothetical protein